MWKHCVSPIALIQVLLQMTPSVQGYQLPPLGRQRPSRQLPAAAVGHRKRRQPAGRGFAESGVGGTVLDLLAWSK